MSTTGASLLLMSLHPGSVAHHPSAHSPTLLPSQSDSIPRTPLVRRVWAGKRKHRVAVTSSFRWGPPGRGRSPQADKSRWTEADGCTSKNTRRVRSLDGVLWQSRSGSPAWLLHSTVLLPAPSPRRSLPARRASLAGGRHSGDQRQAPR